jgi:copper(I)-binding protein
VLGLKRALQAGEVLPVTLQFEKAGQRQIQAPVRQ